jgi:NAD(P)-dependent dehydrogenase (short-subunit alcohol dehydrogenase family)
MASWGLRGPLLSNNAAKNIRVNCVCPGLIQTPMVERIFDKGIPEQEFIALVEPMGRMGTAEEIAQGVVWAAF